MPQYIIDFDGTIIWEPTEEDFERFGIEAREFMGSMQDAGSGE